MNSSFPSAPRSILSSTSPSYVAHSPTTQTLRTSCPFPPRSHCRRLRSSTHTGATLPRDGANRCSCAGPIRPLSTPLGKTPSPCTSASLNYWLGGKPALKEGGGCRHTHRQGDRRLHSETRRQHAQEDRAAQPKIRRSQSGPAEPARQVARYLNPR